jgi:hypothetical protein
MHVKARWALAMLLAGILRFAPGQALPLPFEDPEAKLTQKLAREQDPVKQAKLEIKLARLKLFRAKDTRGKGGVEESLKLLQAYRAHIENAWNLLQKSGRVAHKKPQGFKELDIELREDGRYLEDLKRSFSLADREPIEKIIADVERIRGEVLKALFPAMEGAAH